MKKKILAILLSLVLVLGAVAVLAACDGGGGGGGDIPVTDGKVTLYWTAEGVTLPEYGSIWFTGGMCGAFGTTPDKAIEAKKVEGKDNVYYVQLALDDSVTQYNEYCLTLGYNSNSGLPESKQGIDWNLKSEQCAAVAYPGNLSFEWNGNTGIAIDLGTHTWSSTLPAPEQGDLTVGVRFAAPLGENAEVYFMGAFTSTAWNATAGKATLNADRTEATLDLTDVVLSSYEYKVVVCEDVTQIDPEHKNDADGNLDVWNALYKTDYKSENGNPVRAFIEINAGGGNFTVTFLKLHTLQSAPVYLAGTTAATGVDDPVAIDLSEAVVSEHQNSGVGDGTYDRKIDTVKIVDLQVTVKFASALAEGVHVWVVGGFGADGWSNFEFTSTDRITWTATVKVDKSKLGTEVEFLITLTPDAEFDYDNKIGENREYGAAKNAAITLPATVENTLALFGDNTIAAPTAALV